MGAGWNVPLIAPSYDAIQQIVRDAPAPNQGGYGADEALAQFQAARDAALDILARGLVGTTGVFRVALSGSAQPLHGAAPGAEASIPLETITVEIARHAPLHDETYTAGPVTVRMSAPSGVPTDYPPLEAVSIQLERHEPRTGLRSYQ